MILTKTQIANLIINNELVTDYTDIAKQLQPAGFDYTLDKILFYDPADFKKQEQLPINFSDAKQIFLDDFSEWDFDKSLIPLHPYLFVTKEIVKMPKNVTGIIFPRSSLTKLGIVLCSGVTDAGYIGNLSFSIISPLPVRFERGQRFAQMIFIEHDETTPYSGQYQGNVR